MTILERLHAHFKYLSEQIAELERELSQQLAEDDLDQRPLSIPGVGPSRNTTDCSAAMAALLKTSNSLG